MTFYQAVVHLKANGWTMLRKYKTHEIWEKGGNYFSLPDLERLPSGISKKVKAVR